MDLLVLGANGLLGSNLVSVAADRGMTVVAGYHTDAPEVGTASIQVDITHQSRVAAVLEQTSPDIVLNAAAMTDVDACERSPERARRVNGEAPGHLAALASQRDIGLVHVSTDYVFDGETDGQYSESDSPNPIQVYGESKLLGERTVRDAHPRALVPRLSFVYGRHAGSGELEGFPAWVREQLNKAVDVPGFTDQYITPSQAQQAAETIISLLGEESRGVVHTACRTCTTPYEMARTVAKVDDYDPTHIIPSRMATVDRTASRPKRTCLDVTRVERLLGRKQPTFEDDLRSAL